MVFPKWNLFGPNGPFGGNKCRVHSLVFLKHHSSGSLTTSQLRERQPWTDHGCLESLTPATECGYICAYNDLKAWVVFATKDVAQSVPKLSIPGMSTIFPSNSL